MIKSLNVNWSFNNFRDIVALLFGLLHIISYILRSILVLAFSVVMECLIVRV